MRSRWAVRAGKRLRRLCAGDAGLSGAEYAILLTVTVAVVVVSVTMLGQRVTKTAQSMVAAIGNTKKSTPAPKPPADPSTSTRDGPLDQKLWGLLSHDPNDLHPVRVAFLRKVMQGAPYDAMEVDASVTNDAKVLALPGRYYLIYFDDAKQTVLTLDGDSPFRADGIDVGDMQVNPLGDIPPGQTTFTAPDGKYLLRLSASEAQDDRRPQFTASVRPLEGPVPLTVEFAVDTVGRVRWDFGDDAHATKAHTRHVFERVGDHTVTLTVTDSAQRTAQSFFRITAWSPIDEPIVRVGLRTGDASEMVVHGHVEEKPDGALEFGNGPPWRRVIVHPHRGGALDELKSLTILGWLNPKPVAMVGDSQRIACNLGPGRAGFDLVRRSDGSLRLAINAAADDAGYDSTPGRVPTGVWTFFAVTFDAMHDTNNVRWFFGGPSAAATHDRADTCPADRVGPDCGTLTVGNANESFDVDRLDQQFRGQIRSLHIFGHGQSGQGALPLEAILGHQSRPQ